MSISRGEVKGQILRVLQKDGSYQGFYTDEKLNDAIQDCIDYISVEMFMAGDGWLRKIVTLDSAPNSCTVDLPAFVSVIDEVRYLVGNSYIPLTYDDASLSSQSNPVSGVTQFPSRYRIVDQKIYFNPAPGVGGKDFLQIEYCTYPQILVADGQLLPNEFDRCMVHFIKWRSASLLASSVGKYQKEWGEYESEWKERMVMIVNKRTKSPIFIRDFSGA